MAAEGHPPDRGAGDQGTGSSTLGHIEALTGSLTYDDREPNGRRRRGLRALTDLLTARDGQSLLEAAISQAGEAAIVITADPELPRAADHLCRWGLHAHHRLHPWAYEPGKEPTRWPPLPGGDLPVSHDTSGRR